MRVLLGREQTAFTRRWMSGPLSIFVYRVEDDQVHALHHDSSPHYTARTSAGQVLAPRRLGSRARTATSTQPLVSCAPVYVSEEQSAEAEADEVSSRCRPNHQTPTDRHRDLV